MSSEVFLELNGFFLSLGINRRNRKTISKRKEFAIMSIESNSMKEAKFGGI
jgi:hypothetical protein